MQLDTLLTLLYAANVARLLEFQAETEQARRVFARAAAQAMERMKGETK